MSTGCLPRLQLAASSLILLLIFSFTSPITILGRLVRFTIGFLDGRDLPHLTDLKAWNGDFEANGDEIRDVWDVQDGQLPK